MSESLKPGDRVEWESSQGTETGKVKKKLTKPTKIKGHQVAASHSKKTDYTICPYQDPDPGMSG